MFKFSCSKATVNYNALEQTQWFVQSIDWLIGSWYVDWLMDWPIDWLIEYGDIFSKFKLYIFAQVFFVF